MAQVSMLDGRAQHGERGWESAFAARDPGAGRFFAIPFEAIAGFEEVANAARSLATLPVGVDLGHYTSREYGDSENAKGRRQMQAALDLAWLDSVERQQVGVVKLKQRLERQRKPPPQQAAERRDSYDAAHEWHLGPTNCFFKTSAPRSASLRESVNRFFRCECQFIADLFYPPGAFKGLHTDRFSRVVGWILFLVQVAQPGRSSFRYVDPRTGELVVIPDRNEVAYIFRTSAERPFFWHGVLCEDTFRWSQGFWIPPDWQAHVRPCQ